MDTLVSCATSGPTGRRTADRESAAAAATARRSPARRRDVPGNPDDYWSPPDRSPGQHRLVRWIRDSDLPWPDAGPVQPDPCPGQRNLVSQFQETIIVQLDSRSQQKVSAGRGALSCVRQPATSELVQKTHIIAIQGANVRDVVTPHAQSLHAQAEGKTGDSLRIVSHGLQHVADPPCRPRRTRSTGCSS